MKKVVYEYILDSLGMIKEIRAWKSKKRPELIENPEPPIELQEIGALRDQYGRPCWLFRDNQVRKVDLGDPTPVEDAQRYFQELSKLDMLKLLFKGIENKNDSDYTDFVDKINLL